MILEGWPEAADISPAQIALYGRILEQFAVGEELSAGFDLIEIGGWLLLIVPGSPKISRHLREIQETAGFLAGFGKTACPDDTLQQ
ncbi:hypothetical protein, partial [Martelella sp. AD-3]|uniref:hypothetical protein n=1 Tax=Martelella sp. AD-3 TaxID=686597 RepID=UPI001AEC0E33